MLSVHFTKALASGRRAPPLPDTRERVLVTLLRKRAAARTVGDEELEDLLRAQIKWSLPTVVPEDVREVA